MSFAVKEIYYTLQGEGAHTGRPAVFLRFAGCNLWSGREEDRTHAVCSFCDTDFVGTDGPYGGKYRSAEDLAEAVRRLWPKNSPESAYVVCTGGEPLLQLDETLIEALHRSGFEVAVETNGTKTAPEGLDWICMSPKAGAAVALTSGDELKLVYPQQGIRPEDVQNFHFRHFFLQPMDGPDQAANIRLAVEYCLRNP
ncbi:MAG: 7-carboxy-7-deazaguanine synthase, partial [Bacteroidota bacterium]